MDELYKDQKKTQILLSGSHAQHLVKPCPRHMQQREYLHRQPGDGQHPVAQLIDRRRQRVRAAWRGPVAGRHAQRSSSVAAPNATSRLASRDRLIGTCQRGNEIDLAGSPEAGRSQSFDRRAIHAGAVIVLKSSSRLPAFPITSRHSPRGTAWSSISASVLISTVRSGSGAERRARSMAMISSLLLPRSWKIRNGSASNCSPSR